MGDVSGEATADAGGKNNCCVSRKCGYEYMTPSYVEDDDEAAKYPAIADALLENSSAHGLPTFYRAQGDSHMQRNIFAVIVAGIDVCCI